MENKALTNDKIRYGSYHMPIFQKYFRKYNEANTWIMKKLFSTLYKCFSFLYKVEIPLSTKIGDGLYIGHQYCITINEKVTIGTNCNIHKGVTLGQENRGTKKGCPKIGNDVWIGINSTIVGKIKIGDDVLIAPNSYINTDVPSHSVVLGNPCKIIQKNNATESYINNRC